MGEIIDGKKVSEELLGEIKLKVEAAEVKYGKKPALTVILVGDNPASKVYVGSKEKKALEIGFNSTVVRLSAETTAEELSAKIKELNENDSVDAILLQLPLPKGLNGDEFVGKISPEKDVDGFHPQNLGKLMTNTNPSAVACTPLGVIKLLEKYDVEVEGKNCVVVGRSNIVGKPLAQLLLNLNGTVIMAHSKTKNLPEVTRQADILISAVGRKNLITKDMVKQGAVVVDVGILKDENGKLFGDVDFENVKEVASLITPVPGGVGPMTIACLMSNTLDLFLKRQEARAGAAGAAK